MVESTNYGVIAGYAAVERAARAADVIAFRASTKIALLVRKGTRVIPVSPSRRRPPTLGSTTASRARQREHAGFDFGNLPTEIEAAELPQGATVVLSTTNGTREIEAAEVPS